MHHCRKNNKQSLSFALSNLKDKDRLFIKIKD